MIIFRNVDYNGFISESANKDIVVWGAGNNLNDFLFNHKRDGRVLLLDRIVSVLDNDPLKIGRKIDINKKTIKVNSFENHLGEGENFNNCVVILMLANRYLLSVIKQLDAIREMDGLVCYYGLSALNWGNELFPSLPSNPCLPRPKSDHKIPKTIHYCWFGGNPLPDSAKDCIESWKKYCLDYELSLWNEDNYDISKTPVYVRQAYDAKKYAFVSDYARLDVVYRHGGFYLDTDVEIVKSLDDLISYKAMFAFECTNLVATGLGFGSVSQNPLIGELRDFYKDIEFINNDGTQNTTPCPKYHTDFFRRRGVEISNRLQLHDGILFLPSDYFCPTNQSDTLYKLTGNTHGIHKFSCSWFEPGQLKEWENTKREIKLINRRLLADWKKEHNENA